MENYVLSLKWTFVKKNKSSFELPKRLIKQTLNVASSGTGKTARRIWVPPSWPDCWIFCLGVQSYGFGKPISKQMKVLSTCGMEIKIGLCLLHCNDTLPNSYHGFTIMSFRELGTFSHMLMEWVILSSRQFWDGRSNLSGKARKFF